jgi:hypothetical protein
MGSFRRAGFTSVLGVAVRAGAAADVAGVDGLEADATDDVLVDGRVFFSSFVDAREGVAVAVLVEERPSERD